MSNQQSIKEILFLFCFFKLKWLFNLLKMVFSFQNVIHEGDDSD
jgi:hypothetical protein